jgi:hypothetical protein
VITKPCKRCAEGKVEFAMTGGHAVGNQPPRHNGECSTCGWPHYIMLENPNLYDANPTCPESTYRRPPESKGIRAGRRVERSVPLLEVTCRLAEGHTGQHEAGMDGSVRW